MRFILTYLLVTGAPSVVQCQLYVSDGTEECYAQPDLRESFSVHVKSISIDKGKADTFFSGIIEKKVYSKGLLRKSFKYVDKNSFICYEYFYKDTNSVKCTLRNNHKKLKEVYYYTYDKNNNLIQSVGYDKEKIIYKMTGYNSGNKTIKKTYINHDFILANDYEYTIISDDGLEELLVSTANNGIDSFYFWKRYNEKKQIVFEKDSSENHVDIKIYNYDSLGRLKELRWGNPEIHSIKTYVYNVADTKILTVFLSKNGKGIKDTTEFEILNYDQSGNLLHRRWEQYSKLPEDKAPAEIVEKFYANNRLQKVLVTLGAYNQRLYIIRYD